MTGGEILTACLSAASIVVSSLVAYAVAKVNDRQRQEAARMEKLDTLDVELKVAVKTELKSELSNYREMTDERFERVWERFKDGEGRFERLETRDQKIEILIERRLGSIDSAIAVIKDRLGVKDE
jgi:citrate lyase alpha subunit